MSLNITSDGSPTPRKGRFSMTEELRLDTSPEALGMAGVKRPNSTSQEAPIPLASSTRVNQPLGQPPQHYVASRMADHIPFEGYKKLKTNQDNHSEQTSASVVDSLLQRLSDHSSPLDQHYDGKRISTSNLGMPNPGLAREYDTSSQDSIPITPATNEHSQTPETDLDSNPAMKELRQQLQETQTELARMQQEAHASQVTKLTLDHTIGHASETEYTYCKDDISEQTISQLQDQFNASTRPNYGRQNKWQIQDDAVTEKNDVKLFGHGQGIWDAGPRPSSAFSNAVMGQQYPPPLNGWGTAGEIPRQAPYYGNHVNPGMGLNNQGFGPIQPASRPPHSQNGYRGRNAFLNEPMHFPLDPNIRGGLTSNPPSRPGSAFGNPRYGQYPGNLSPSMQQMSAPPMGAYGVSSNVSGYAPRPNGSRLSPEAVEFSVDPIAPSPWNSQTPQDTGVVMYAATAEPMNYRRLLDRNMNCNWKYIVDKIICSNDQQASIFLQQKLKVGTSEQKYEIVDAIISQAYPLMINRFGNFLVQRCFEHGTPEQVIAIAGAIRGNVLTLSMDAFGCHVIQKAFDAVPEEYKATMVHELLRRIPETVIHRYACHVWQKLFELRWVDSPPQIMRYVNEALRGMWHEVALGETGSLVVQNIFENCLDGDKRPCIDEVLASIDVIAQGQFGNWCIQHICEHGGTTDRSRAIEHIIRFATEYSMDQYASKVIEKCLKIGGNEFLDRYLDRVCEGRADRPRMPLIDIAGDQFGNYLIQYILTNSSAHHRELVASHVRKHMVSLRGSKYGSRVAMLCCNPALATRPGPPAGMQVNRYNSSNLHRGGGGYSGFR